MANRKNLVVAVATELSISQVKAKPIVETIINSIKNNLKLGDCVKLVNFGKFSVVDRAARNGRNPQTGEALYIPAKKVIKFKSGKALADNVNTDWDTVETEENEIDDIVEEIESEENDIQETEEALEELIKCGEDVSDITEISID